ncbi:TetR/AcrR family transcriptional regulator [Peribacillus loiseleuriae]|uniref:TetR family transcriptional regulator n=1 Tax=Peribacillus loiseleuriae TaxID=1679170 RepID=A0A0K9GYA5_9BACI|nr:TetR/AcrR family transcriptional regulator [Peribacillus loiseleuriae]KMY51580.1 TetR family transcriptional regulator [Peribacillus loiseleuriae]
MNKKKRNVIDKAHELFIIQGYHATSIQDILNHSGISKGSFYNYFTSKGELFKAVFNLIQDNMESERDKLLIGEDLTDKDIFIKQVSFMMELSWKNKIIQLIEDVFASNDPDLITFIKQSKYFYLTWIYERFLNIFPKNQEKYLVDCAVLYTGMMKNMMHTSKALNRIIPVPQMAQYCLDRVMTILDDISRKDIHLFVRENINQLHPQLNYNDFFNNEFSIATLNVKKVMEKQLAPKAPKLTTYLNLLYFIQEEIMNKNEDSKHFLIESALTTLKTGSEFNDTNEFITYEQILANMKYYPIA